jgi:DNA-directed RNA polymerase specialized sigma24 family protein
MLTGGDGIGSGSITGPEAAVARESWSELVHRFAPYVHAIAVQAYGLAPDDAEDVFQDVFLQAWTRVGQPGGEAGLEAWFAVTARNAAAERGVASEELLRQLDEALSVGEAIRRLPDGQREVARRFFVDREDLPAIAAEVGRDIGSVADEVRRARRRMRRELDEARRRRSAR